MKTTLLRPASGLSRRKFIGQTGSLSFLLLAGSMLPKFVTADDREDAIEEQKITAWVQITKDGKVTIYNPAAEMGQGSMTALAVIIAEEMDADWNKVTIENSPIIPEVYGLNWNGTLGGAMMTVGSRTIKGYYAALRQAGAKARYVLLYNAAAKWGVPLTELKTEPGMVIHAASNRKMSYGEIAAIAKLPATIPDVPEDHLKKESEFRLIGKVMHRFDVPEKVDGSAKFGIDIKLPGLVYGAINRSPVNGTKPELLNEAAVRAAQGVIDIVKLDYGIGVVAKTYPQAIAAKRLMEIKWSGDVKAKGYNSDATYATYVELAKNDEVKGRSSNKKGDVEAGLKAAGKKMEREYLNDYLCHAQMEPLNAVANVAPDGQTVDAWAGSQMPDQEKSDVAKALNIPLDKVNFNPCYLGGGFGRRHGEYVVEAALLSRQVKKPVKMIWTREDDFEYGMFRPTCLQRLQAVLDDNKKISTWSHTIVGPDPRLQTGGVVMDYYDIPNQLATHKVTDHGIRTAYWRSVGHGANKFAAEAFMNEIAHELGEDAVAYRRKHMENMPRYLALLDKVTQMSNWSSPAADGRVKGVACSDYGGSYTAGVVEISLNRETGKIKVHQVWLAADAGVVVQPENAIAQMEGGIIMGISSSLQERVNFVDGKVQQSNFYNYSLLRMSDAPENIEVALLPSSLPPTSMGELSLPIVGGAIAGAFLKLTGKALRHMPFTPQKVLKVLDA